MKIKKFVAPDIRRAIRMVREEQGPDAVILSNRRVAGGVEIVSAVDYDETLFKAARDKPEDTITSSQAGIAAYQAEAQAGGDDYSRLLAETVNNTDLSQGPKEPGHATMESVLSATREELKYLRAIVETRFFDLEWTNYTHSNPASAELIRSLLNCGISAKLAGDIAREIPYITKAEDVWQNGLEKLTERIRIAEDDIVDGGGIVALVGPTGVGKTTTVAKLAARYALRRGVRHAALVTTDNYRVGAHEQLRTYGRLLDIPMYSASSKDELQTHLEDLLDKNMILIDTAGMSQRDMRISEQLSVLKGSKFNIKVYLVISATSQLAGIEEVIDVFRGVELDGCIITKLDEATRIGPVVSAVIEKKLSVAYISDGQRVPEDLHLARADKLVNKENFNMQKCVGSTAEEVMHFIMGRTARNAH